MIKKDVFYNISKIEWDKIEDTYEKINYLSTFFEKANRYMIVAAINTIDAFPEVYEYHKSWKIKIPVVYGVKLSVNYQGKSYTQICLARCQEGLDNIYRLMSLELKEIDFYVFQKYTNGLFCLYDLSENEYLPEGDVFIQQTLIFDGSDCWDEEFGTEIEAIVSKVDYHKIKVFPDRNEIDEFYIYEKQIIDECLLQFLYYQDIILNEYGITKFRLIEKLLRLEIQELEEKKLVMVLVMLKVLADFARENRITLRFARNEQRSLLLRLLGVTSKSDEEFFEYLEYIDFKKELEKYSSGAYILSNYPAICVGVEQSSLFKILKHLEDSFAKYRLVKVDDYTTEEYFALIPQREVIPVKERKYWIDGMKFDIAYYTLLQMCDYYNIIGIWEY